MFQGEVSPELRAHGASAIRRGGVLGQVLRGRLMRSPSVSSSSERPARARSPLGDVSAGRATTGV